MTLLPTAAPVPPKTKLTNYCPVNNGSGPATSRPSSPIGPSSTRIHRTHPHEVDPSIFTHRLSPPESDLRARTHPDPVTSDGYHSSVYVNAVSNRCEFSER